MEKFAKLFETESLGQIAVIIGRNYDANPEVRLYFTGGDVGVCSVAPSFDDTEEGWDRAEALFTKMNEEEAIEIVNPHLKFITGQLIP